MFSRFQTYQWGPVLCALLLSALACDPAIASDPFSIIFGDPDHEARGNPDEAHEDNLVLVSVALRDYALLDVVSAYQTADDLCVEAEPVIKVLELPITLHGDTLSGWIAQKSDTVDFDLAKLSGRYGGRDHEWSLFDAQNTPQGWCITLSRLSELTHVPFDYDPGTLSVSAQPEETLPIEARLERARIRALLLEDQEVSSPDFERVDTPYRWLSAPVLDVFLDVDTQQRGSLPRINIEAAGDFLKSTAQFRSIDTGGGKRSIRLSLSRTSEHADQLGLLKASHFALGHIAGQTQPLISRSLTGVGAVVTNVPNYQDSLFDETDITGVLPIGWEAELYQDGRLIAFTDQPDTNGQFRFSSVPLLLGFNRLVVKLYGPFGETDQQIFTRFVGGSQCPDGVFRYTASIISPDSTQSRQTVDDLIASTSEETEQSHRDLRVSGTLEYGLTPHISTRMDSIFNPSNGDLKGSFSLLGSFDAIYGGVRLASDGRGVPALNTFAQSRLSDATALSVNWTEFGDLSSDISGEGGARLIRQGRARLETQIRLGVRTLPVRTSLLFQKREDGQSNLAGAVTTNANVRGINFGHTLSLRKDSQGSQLEGGLIASRTVRGARIRGGATYGTGGSSPIKALTLSGQRNFGSKTILQASTSYDMNEKAFALEGALTRQFSHFTATTRGGLNAQGDVFAGLSLGFSLHKPRGRSYRMAPPGLSRTGGIELLTFIDEDADGHFGNADRAVKNAAFMVDNSIRGERSDVGGVTMITGLDPHRAIDASLQLSSLDDPFLKPAINGRRVTVRPGHVVTIAIPLLPTGDIDGVVELERAGHRSPLSGVTVEIVDPTGRVVQTVMSEYDGYFYADGIVSGDYTIRVAQDDLELIGASATSFPMALTKDEPSVTNIGLKIKVADNVL